MEENRKKTGSIILQVTIMFLIIVVITGLLTYFTQYRRSTELVESQLETRARRMADEVTLAVKEYPAYNWLLDFWCSHYDMMDIEYDVDYIASTETAEKAGELQKKYPDIQLRYASEDEIKKLPYEDQKKYAEVVYSWLITHVNQIKRVNDIDFLFCIVTEEPYDRQFFLFSAADEDALRGVHYEEVYPLGVRTKVSESQQDAMKNAINNNSHIVDAGEYVDYYSHLDTIDDKYLLVGVTLKVSTIEDSIVDGTIYGTYISMILHMLLLSACLFGIYFLVLKPLKEVQKSIRQYKKSKDSVAVESSLANVRPDNEIGELAADISDLSQEMNKYLGEIQDITAEKERIETELNLAKRIQHSMLPHEFPPFPERHEFEIFANMDAAKEVGGDFYDFYLIDEDHLCMVMADVSGKGIPAALFMMATKIIIQSVAMLGGSAEEILEKTNEALCSNNQAEMFVTVWLGILEISTGKLTAVNAGHEYPALKKAGGEYEIIKSKHGFVVGGMEDVKYKHYELELEPGSRLFLYTDGVPEATDADQNLFGTDRMIEALNAELDIDTEQTLINVRKKVDEFVKDAEQFDDLTMMCFEYKGSKH